VISYQKQIIGRQVSAGVFDFLGTNFFDASLGESALEPVQLAVRSVIERATLEMISRIYHTPQAACSNIGTASDPLAGPDDASPYSHVQIANTNANPNSTPIHTENHNDAPHQNPYRFYSSADPADDNGLRGGLN
jgi:curli production assembly/transport component CsgG/holdfast attachment protein HfaB